MNSVKNYSMILIQFYYLVSKIVIKTFNVFVFFNQIALSLSCKTFSSKIGFKKVHRR